jgi:hypothetical protein
MVTYRACDPKHKQPTVLRMRHVTRVLASSTTGATRSNPDACDLKPVVNSQMFRLYMCRVHIGAVR